ncbi:SNARE-binding exocyst subunit S6, partial [Cryomyces antarcticus]
TAGKFKRSDPFVEKIKDDVLTVFGFFERFENSFPEIKAKWRVVEGFVSLLEADKAAVPAVFERFRADYWDVQMAWVEAVVRARDDFDRGMLSAVKAKASEVYVERGVETIMSKVK